MTRPMRIYVSGPITGSEHDAEERFREAMRRDLLLLLDCDGVALLDGWEESRGCKAEVAVAEAIGIPARPIAEWVADE